MHEDDAMDLNDEGVLAMYTECCGFLRAGDQWPEGAMHSAVPHDHTPVLRLVALRAVPESDELVRLRALLDEASRSSHQNGQLFTKGAMHPGSWERCEAMSCSDARAALSPDEAAGDE